MAWPSKDPQDYQYQPPPERTAGAASHIKGGAAGGAGALVATSLAAAVGLELTLVLFLVAVSGYLVYQRRRTGASPREGG